MLWRLTHLERLSRYYCTTAPRSFPCLRLTRWGYGTTTNTNTNHTVVVVRLTETNFLAEGVKVSGAGNGREYSQLHHLILARSLLVLLLLRFLLLRSFSEPYSRNLEAHGFHWTRFLGVLLTHV